MSQTPTCERLRNSSAMSTTVQRQYESQMDLLAPKERIARCVALLKWSRDLIARQILAENGPCSFERLKWEVAMRQYGSDPRMKTMIQRMLERVSD